jgi:uncharacterized membrane protein
LQHLVYLKFVTRLIPTMPAWIPAHSLLAGLFGVFLIAAGVMIIFGKVARPAALLLGAVSLVSFIALYMPLLIPNLGNGGLWASSGKAIAIAGGSFLVAGSLPVKLNYKTARFYRFLMPLENFIHLASYFLSYFLILCGFLHFVYVEIVADLVPSWIPGHIFWAYFAGVALIAGGVGMIVRQTSRLAATLTGLMISLWIVLLHIPRAAADLRDSNETTAVFEALAISGAAFLIAALPRKIELKAKPELERNVPAPGIIRSG